MSLFRSVLRGGIGSCLLPRAATTMVSMRGYGKKPDHNPSPKCSDNKSGGGCGKINDCGDPRFAPKDRNVDNDPFQFHHLVAMPDECCDDPCFDRFPPFDDCYYKISDKAKRHYQVTWVECPPIKIKPKKICCFEKGIRPPVPRRKRKEFQKADECPQEPQCTIVDGPCPKIRLPGCKPVRSSVFCHVTRRITPCTKVNAPYPAFSECDRPRMRPHRRIECNCLTIPSQCELIRELKSRGGSPRKGNCGGSSL